MVAGSQEVDKSPFVKYLTKPYIPTISVYQQDGCMLTRSLIETLFIEKLESKKTLVELNFYEISPD